jgi:hypothetical protein
VDIAHHEQIVLIHSTLSTTKLCVRSRLEQEQEQGRQEPHHEKQTLDHRSRIKRWITDISLAACGFRNRDGDAATRLDRCGNGRDLSTSAVIP